MDAPVTFLPLTPAMRARIEATVEQMVAMLDAVDGDAAAEPDEVA